MGGPRKRKTQDPTTKAILTFKVECPREPTTPELEAVIDALGHVGAIVEAEHYHCPRPAATTSLIGGRTS